MPLPNPALDLPSWSSLFRALSYFQTGPSVFSLTIKEIVKESIFIYTFRDIFGPVHRKADPEKTFLKEVDWGKLLETTLVRERKEQD